MIKRICPCEKAGEEVTAGGVGHNGTVKSLRRVGVNPPIAQSLFANVPHAVTITIVKHQPANTAARNTIDPNAIPTRARRASPTQQQWMIGVVPFPPITR